MTRIYKIDFMGPGLHIDLDKIVAISDAYFIDEMGSGGWFVGFWIEVQLKDERLYLRRELVDETEVKFSMTVGHQLKVLDASWQGPHVYSRPDIVAVHNLQRDIDGLIEKWKASAS